MKILLLRFRLPFILSCFFVFLFNNSNAHESNLTRYKTKAFLSTCSPTGSVSKLDIKLFQATGQLIGAQTDGVLARYNNIYLESPYETYDVAKLNNFNENLSLVRSDRYLSIESRPFPTKQDTLYLSCWGLKNQDYAFTITSSQFIGLNQTAVLIDAFTGQHIFIDLSDGTITYPFSISSDPASNSLDRFKIIMTPITVLPVSFSKLSAAWVGTKVQISWATGSELGVKNYTVERSMDGASFSKTGEVAARNTANEAGYQWVDNQPLPGINYYRIYSNLASGKFNYSTIVSLQPNAQKGMQVMPTVISNRRFTLLLNEQSTGNYQLTITNSAGQQVYQKLLSNIAGNCPQLVELGNAPIPTGIYNLSVSGLNGRHQNFRLLIN
jgi:hypothetical protein